MYFTTIKNVSIFNKWQLHRTTINCDCRKIQTKLYSKQNMTGVGSQEQRTPKPL